eukprot:10113633-Alexandrium_andersonii.AAC.1
MLDIRLPRLRQAKHTRHHMQGPIVSGTGCVDGAVGAAGAAGVGGARGDGGVGGAVGAGGSGGGVA